MTQLPSLIAIIAALCLSFAGPARAETSTVEGGDPLDQGVCPDYLLAEAEYEALFLDEREFMEAVVGEISEALRAPIPRRCSGYCDDVAVTPVEPPEPFTWPAPVPSLDALEALEALDGFSLWIEG